MSKIVFRGTTKMSEDELSLIQSTAQVVADFAFHLGMDFEVSHDLIDEIGARAHRIVDQAKEANKSR